MLNNLTISGSEIKSEALSEMINWVEGQEEDYSMPFVAKLFTTMDDSYFKNQLSFFSEPTQLFYCTKLVFQLAELVIALSNSMVVLFK